MKYPDNSKWLNVTKCPACSCSEIIDKGFLVGDHYSFGDEIIEYPSDKIGIVECKNCCLFFKKTLPTPYFLAEVITRQAGKVWNDDYNFIFERKFIEKFLNNKINFDLLDVGPSNGALLNVFSDLSGRRSGLDIVQHPGLEKYLNGEFIHGLLDKENLDWSENPYDVITIYDVFEHFYNPKVAFRNLNILLKVKGLVVLETGNINSYYAKKYGVSKWWYVNLFEHHIFWQPNSIAYHAKKHGFEILYIKETKHKSWRNKTIIHKVKQIMKLILWIISPIFYKKLANKFKKDGVMRPWTSLTNDHFIVVLQKKV
jgi:2-polyprenyl-3-methyl-5-hydroxy-6-metoxy-1,4-benzoquinol methylase